jgi:hypothetical protein
MNRARSSDRSWEPYPLGTFRLRCPLGTATVPCRSESTHVGLAYGIPWIEGCYWHVRLWARRDFYQELKP